MALSGKGEVQMKTSYVGFLDRPFTVQGDLEKYSFWGKRAISGHFEQAFLTHVRSEIEVLPVGKVSILSVAKVLLKAPKRAQ